MKNYDAADMSQLTAYMGMLQKSLEFSEKADQWEEKDMNNAEILYYSEVLTRCSQKMLDAGLSM